MAANGDELVRLRHQLERDLEIIREYEEIRRRYAVRDEQSRPATISQAVDLAVKQVAATQVAKAGANTGLGHKVASLVANVNGRGTDLNEIVDSLIEMKYPYSTRRNLTASAYQALKRLVEQGVLSKDAEGRYHTAQK